MAPQEDKPRNCPPAPTEPMHRFRRVCVGVSQLLGPVHQPLDQGPRLGVRQPAYQPLVPDDQVQQRSTQHPSPSRRFYPSPQTGWEPASRSDTTPVGRGETELSASLCEGGLIAAAAISGNINSPLSLLLTARRGLIPLLITRTDAPTFRLETGRGRLSCRCRKSGRRAGRGGALAAAAPSTRPFRPSPAPARWLLAPAARAGAVRPLGADAHALSAEGLRSKERAAARGRPARLQSTPLSRLAAAAHRCTASGSLLPVRGLDTTLGRPSSVALVRRHHPRCQRRPPRHRARPAHRQGMSPPGRVGLPL